jgi:hypothetical protein
MTATYTKPTKIPRWADTSANIIEPPEVKKDQGWLFEEIPPSAFENWRTKLTGEWMKWLNERLFDGASKDELVLKSPGNATEAIRITNTEVRLGKDTYWDTGAQYGIKYNSGSSQLELYAGGNLALYANASGLYIDGDLTIEDDLIVPGGLCVGIASPTPVDDEIQLGDADLKMAFDSGTAPYLQFGASGDKIAYNRASDYFQFKIADVEEVRVKAAGLNVGNGLYVGDLTTAPTDDCIGAAASISAGTFLGAGTYVSAGSYVQATTYVAATTFLRAGDGTIQTPNSSSYIYNSATGGNIYCNLAGVMWWTAAGLVSMYGGLRVGDATAPGDNNIYAVGEIRAGGDLYADGGTVYVGADDYMNWDGTNMQFVLNGTEEMRIVSDGVRIANGLYVGAVGGTPTDNKIYAEGNIEAGGALMAGDFYADTNYVKLPVFTGSEPGVAAGRMFEYRPTNYVDSIPSIRWGAGATAGVNHTYAKVRGVHKSNSGGQQRTTTGAFSASYYNIPLWAMMSGSLLRVKAWGYTDYAGGAGNNNITCQIGMSGGAMIGSPCTAPSDWYLEADFFIESMGTLASPGTGYRQMHTIQNGTFGTFPIATVNTEGQATAGDGSYTCYVGVTLATGCTASLYHVEWELVV